MKFSILLTMLASLSLPGGLSSDDRVELADGVAFYGAELPLASVADADVEFVLYYALEGADALEDRDAVFVHLEGRDQDTKPQQNCRVVLDATLRADKPERGRKELDVELDSESGLLRVSGRAHLPATCTAGTLEVFTGIWNRNTGDRRALVSETTLDDRIHAGYIELVEPGTSPASGSRAFTPSEMSWRGIWQRFDPWWGWIAAFFTMLALSLAARHFAKRVGAERALEPQPLEHPQSAVGSEDQRLTEAARAAAVKASANPLLAWLTQRPARWLLHLSMAALLVPLMASILVALDFIKDDAYISFRYAHNLANGDGLVFNPGDRLEGFTNFLWTLLMVPFEWAGLDLFQVSEVLGTALMIGLVAAMVLLAQHFHGAGRHLGHVWGALWLSTSSSAVLWATSGMEQPLAMFLPMASVYLLWAGREQYRPGWTLAAGVLMALGCATRPEIHAMAMVVGGALALEAILRRTIAPTTVRWLIGFALVLVPFHAFRMFYFGEWLPNTYYVKTGASTLVWLAGLEKLHEMFEFNYTGWLLVLAPAAFIDRRHTLEKLVVAAISLGFMVYLVKVGVDEMHWHRLYLPALPFLALLAGLGLRNIVLWVSGAVRHRAVPVVLFALAWSLVLWAAWANFKFTYKEMNGFNGRGDLSGTYHPDMGKFITRHERAGGLVAFQDMGSTPYYAPDIAFLDFIGLVDRTVARARHSYGLHPFVATENYRNQKIYDAEMREYFKARNPEWTILTSYVHQSMAEQVARDFDRDPRTDHLKHRRANSYQFDIERDPWFHENYVHVRTWARSATYYLSLYRRRDMWEKVPGEVVLDEVPSGLGGPKASFAGGLELLGAEVEREALERGEFFVTTWWRAPGPMDRDTYIFLHLNRDGYQAPNDHVPGDWLYPAERWRTGDIIEDRVLVQLPLNAAPGEYELHVGVWNRRSGERLAVEDGPNDGAQRVPLGKVEIKPLRAFLDHAIEPTVPEEQRKYPDRIHDHGR